MIFFVFRKFSETFKYSKTIFWLQLSLQKNISNQIDTFVSELRRRQFDVWHDDSCDLSVFPYAIKIMYLRINTLSTWKLDINIYCPVWGVKSPSSLTEISVNHPRRFIASFEDPRIDYRFTVEIWLSFDCRYKYFQRKSNLEHITRHGTRSYWKKTHRFEWIEDCILKFFYQSCTYCFSPKWKCRPIRQETSRLISSP